MSEQLETTEMQGYRVGAVRRLTGISEHTLRAWERRHDVIRPHRTDGGMRIYSETQVARLQLVKALTDCGESIGSIAGLDDEQLRSRLAAHAGRPADATQKRRAPARRLALLEPAIARQIEANPAELSEIDLVAQVDSLDDLMAHAEAADPDLVLVGIDQLGGDLRASLGRIAEAAPDATIVVGYAFAPSRVLDAITRTGARLVRTPVRLGVLRQRLSDLMDMDQARSIDSALREAAAAIPGDLASPASARLFSDAQLSQLSEVRSAIECECPTHLAEIIQKLVAFEHYSAACLSESPRDRELHACLARATGHARAVMEKMLMRVCEQDGIRL